MAYKPKPPVAAPKPLKLSSTMPDGKRTTAHPLLHLIKTQLKEPDTKSDLAKYMGVRPQSLYKWERKCREDRHFSLPLARAIQLSKYFGVNPSLFRPDVFQGAAA